MIGALKRLYGNFRGFDLTGSAVPPMEGALKPNAALDAAPVALRLEGVDNIAAHGEDLVCSTGNELLTLERTGPTSLSVASRRTLPAEITAIAASGNGALAVGLDGQGIVIEGGPHDGRRIDALDGVRLVAPTAAVFRDPDTLIVASGSAEHPANAWKRDLMSHGSSGSVWSVALATGEAARLAAGLEWPAGLALLAGGTVAVSEAWRHRILGFGGGADGRVLLGELPAYPGRIAPAAGGGFWLAMFAPRNPMVEFVLNEKAYRRRMIAEIDPEYWIAPSLRAGRSFLEPIQGGTRKKLNMLKPWSPTWSGGLVARCDAAMRPVASAHSRADGDVHGVTSLAEAGGTLYAGARGSGVIVALDAGQYGGAR